MLTKGEGAAGVSGPRRQGVAAGRIVNPAATSQGPVPFVLSGIPAMSHYQSDEFASADSEVSGLRDELFG